MAELRFADDDDLPRTLLRAREERDRERRDRDGSRDDALPPLDSDHYREPPAHYGFDFATDRVPATVHRLDIPAVHLAAFLLKAVVAAIPALLLLACLLWLGGKGLQVAFPDLGRMQIFIKFGT